MKLIIPGGSVNLLIGVACKRKHAPAIDQQKIQEEYTTTTNI